MGFYLIFTLNQHAIGLIFDLFYRVYTMKKTLFKLFILLFSAFTLQAAEDIFDDIGNAIKSGDSKELSRYFNSNVDLTIINQEEVYSKAQAEMVLREFFLKNSPKSFNILHQGVSKEGSRYAIGTLITSQGVSYRTYFFIKLNGNSAFIQELRFEKD